MPAVVFLDEMDALVCRRGVGASEDVVQRRVMASEDILVVGATNRPELIDDALLRPGRFDKLMCLWIE